MTRILTLSLYYPPHHFGGYEVTCADTMARLVDRGHEVAVLTSDHRWDDRPDPPTTVAVRRELQPYIHGTELYQPSPLRRWQIERRNHAALRRALDEFRPEVVSVWQMGALSLGLLTVLAERGLPLVYVICDDWLCYGPQLDVWTRLWARRPRLARLARSVLGVPTVLPDLGTSGDFCFITESTRQRAEEGSPWTYPGAALVYAAIDTGDFPPPAPGDPGPEPRRIIYAGRFDPRKGIETLVRAMALLDPSWTLEVQGTGDPAYQDVLRGLTAELGVADRVELVDGLPRSELAARYRAADVCVFPSEWEEPFGMVPLEAMSSGTPVVATGVGGSGEFLADGVNCVRYEPGNPEALAAAVRRLGDDPALRAQVVAAGFPTARYFDIVPFTDSIEAWHVGAAAAFPDGRPPSRRFEPEQLPGGARYDPR